MDALIPRGYVLGLGAGGYGIENRAIQTFDPSLIVVYGDLDKWLSSFAALADIHRVSQTRVHEKVALSLPVAVVN